MQASAVELDDLEAVRLSTQLGRALGFFGRNAIHPKQVPVINAMFTPTAEDVAHALEVLAAYAAGVEDGAGAVVLPDGRFVDLALVELARVTLAAAELAAENT